MLVKTGVVGIEAGAYAFLLARYQDTIGHKVYILNSGKPRMIRQPAKKTDQEDALKIAKFIRRYTEEELPHMRLLRDEHSIKCREPFSFRFGTKGRDMTDIVQQIRNGDGLRDYMLYYDRHKAVVAKT